MYSDSEKNKMDKKINIASYINVNFLNRNDVLQFIAEKALDLSIIKNKKDVQKLFNAFVEREEETSTGFDDGIAIPHARIDEIIQPAVIFVRLDKNNKDIDWKAFNGKGSRYFIALLVPAKDASKSHMEILSNIAKSLMNPDFLKVITTSDDVIEINQKFDEIVTSQSNENIPKNDLNEPSRILAITSCPVGIAHTYLAAEKIQNAAKELKINIKVETHGSVGIKNDFTKSEIENAEIIIIASDIGIDKSRFIGKKIFETKIKAAITDPQKLINDAFEKATIFNDTSTKSNNSSQVNSKNEGGFFIKHLLSGVSYMIPFIIFGGLLIAIALGLTKMIYGDAASPIPGTPLYYLLKSGEAAFGLMIAVLSGFIANSIAGRAAIAPAMIVAFIANNTSMIFPIPGIDPNGIVPLGFIGAILYGFLCGYTVKWLNTWNIHKNITALMPIFIIPLGVTLFYALISIFLISPPISFVVGKIGEWMTSIFVNNSTIGMAGRVGIGIGMGLLLGGMIGFDMGGPINKIAFITASSLLTLPTPIQAPMGMVAAAIPIAPLGMGVATQVYRNTFSKEQKSLGISSIIMGFIGISEGAIPFAISDPKKVIPANIIGSAVAGGVAGALGVVGAVAHGGPIVGILGAIGGNIIGGNSTEMLALGITFFFLAIIIGTATTVLSYGLFLKFSKNHEKVDNKLILSIKNMNLKISEKVKLINNNKNSFKNNGNSIKENKKKIIFSVILICSIITLIVGLAFTIQYSNVIYELKILINSGKTIVLSDFLALKGSIYFVYGIFALVSSLLFIGTLTGYSFSFKEEIFRTKNSKYYKIK